MDDSIAGAIVKRLIVLFVLVLAGATASAQTVRYVQDFVKVPLRTGKSTQNKILRMLPSGTRVEELEVSEQEGYSRIRTPQGIEGWLLTRYLMDEPIARERLARAENRLARQSEEAEQFKHEISTLKAHKAEVERSNEELQRSNEDLSEELSNIRRTASRALAIERENEQFREENAAKSEELDTLLRENTALKDRSRREWFVAGAGVVLAGFVLGLIIPRIPWRRRKRWDQF